MAFDLKRMKKTAAAVDNVDVMHEVFRHLDAKTLSVASCVSKIWCEAAKDDNLWEVICTQQWPPTEISIGRLRSVVNVMGGFRHLYVKWLHPLQRNNGDCGKNSLNQTSNMWSEDQSAIPSVKQLTKIVENLLVEIMEAGGFQFGL